MTTFIPARSLTGLLLLAAFPSLLSAATEAKPPTRFEELDRYPAVEARQGVAVDANHVYVVTNRGIGKYRRADWVKVAAWESPEDGPIIHYNDAFLHNGRLYCAHGNYPDMPSLSSIEIHDARTLEHIGSHSFGHDAGFANWVERRDGRWYVCFAHYTGRAEQPGRNNLWTQVVEFDDEWRRLRAWAFPPALVERFHGRSNSGGAFGPGGYLYVTGHDEKELYVLRFPRMGSYFEWIGTIDVSFEGQAFAFDPTDPNRIWGIVKQTLEVVAGRLLP